MAARIMRHLAAMGTVHEVDVGTFANTPFSKSLTARSFQDLVVWMQVDIAPVSPVHFANLFLEIRRFHSRYLEDASVSGGD